MRRALLVIGLVACGAASAPQTPQPVSDPIGTGETSVQHDTRGALVAEQGAQRTATAAPITPAECGGLPADLRYFGRSVTTGDLPGPEWLSTYALGQEGDRATFVAEQKSAPRPPNWRSRPTLEGLSWQCVQSLRATGSITRRGSQIVLRLAEAEHGDEVHEIACSERVSPVARASAVRALVPSEKEGCNKHRWSPAADVTTRLLECKLDERDRWPVWAIDRVLFLAQLPGVEHLTLDEDDCWDPSTALRLVAPGGGFAPVRAP